MTIWTFFLTNTEMSEGLSETNRGKEGEERNGNNIESR